MIDEQMILDSFRCYRGGMDFLGVKPQWWAKLVTDEEETIGLIRTVKWRPTKDQMDVADKLLFDILLKLNEYDRKLLVLRCGTGFKRSYRKCAKVIGLHHEVFRQEYQAVIGKVKILFDEMA